MAIRTLTVSELTNYLKRILINDPILNNLSIKGEISNFKLHNSGHAYFSIKDNDSKLKCVMFAREFANLDFFPEDGTKVVLKGYVSIYDRNGEYQLYVSEMEKEGLGELYVTFEKLKKKLEAEGYFDPLLKKNLPLFPRKIAVVTSPTGAAIRDVISVISRRNTLTNIVIYPVLVQGDRASIQIAEAIDKLNTFNDIELIILTRGGGSIEELWAFNEEIVAESIFNSKVPIISAVGHETDFTISDFVADLRAPTPSAAGEIAVPNLEDIKDSINLLYNNLKSSTLGMIGNYRSIIENHNEERLRRNIEYKFNEEKLSLDYLYNNLYSIINNEVKSFKKDIISIGNNLNSLSPLATVSRGYGIVLDSKEKPIKDINEVSLEEKIKVIIKKGIIECTVDDIQKGEGILG